VNPLLVADCQAVQVFMAVDGYLLLSTSSFCLLFSLFYVIFLIFPSSSTEHKAHTVFI